MYFQVNVGLHNLPPTCGGMEANIGFMEGIIAEGYKLGENTVRSELVGVMKKQYVGIC